MDIVNIVDIENIVDIVNLVVILQEPLINEALTREL